MKQNIQYLKVFHKEFDVVEEFITKEINELRKDPKWVYTGVIISKNDLALFYGWKAIEKPDLGEPFVTIGEILGDKPSVEVACKVEETAAKSRIFIQRFSTFHYKNVNAYPLSFLVKYFTKKHPELTTTIEKNRDELLEAYHERLNRNNGIDNHEDCDDGECSFPF